MQNRPFSCRIGEKLMLLNEPLVMGIVNINDDSFYQHGDLDFALDLTRTHLTDGAQIIDIGVCSTRPGAAVISEAEELRKLIPSLHALRKAFPEVVFSVDTFRGKVVEEAYNAIGAFIVNDVSGGKWDSGIWEQAARLKLPYILTYSQGLPREMQSECVQTPILEQMVHYFAQTTAYLKAMGLTDIWLDPGFGFGKTLEQNYEILSNLRIFEVFNCPILVGISRKSMIYNALQTTPENSLVGTSVAHHIALMQGASILRVHDAAAARDTLRIWEKSQQYIYHD